MLTIFNTAGGLALILLAMLMMTGGLKVFIGPKLKNFFREWTSSPLRGVISGALVTGIVQSSSAVTVATIGFVNAGILTLVQALGVIFGSNVGTTMTGWLVNLVGHGFKVEVFVMPILAVGVALRFMASRKRIQALGETLTGFGLFFLGLSILKDSFSGVAQNFGTGLITSNDIGGVFTYIFAGFMMTVLTQSSSAAIAVILMAASESIIGVNAAAAGIIGANIGTTSTTALTAINATPNAKRVAAGHVIFNVITGIAALLILPGLLWITSKFGHLAGFGNNTVSIPALFHTIFNVFGVAIMLPLTPRLVNFLSKLFKTEQEDLSRPQYLDKTVVATPSVAVVALWQELLRLNDFVCSILLAAIKLPLTKPETIKKKSELAFSLGQTVNGFVTKVRMENMTCDVAEELAQVIRTTRYLEEAVELSTDANALVHDFNIVKKLNGGNKLEQLFSDIQKIVALAQKRERHDSQLVATDQFQFHYQETKVEFLRAVVLRELSSEKAEELLDKMSNTRRMTEQLVKAGQTLEKYYYNVSEKEADI